MNKLASLELDPDNSTLYVYDSVLDLDSIDPGFPEQALVQGFSGHPRSYKFFTLGDCRDLRVEIWQAEMYPPSPKIVLREDTVRAIAVPFSISFCTSGSGFIVRHILGLAELKVHLSPGHEFALVFEIKLRDDPEYLNSSEYREDVDGGFTRECCYLTFYRREEPIQPEVLRTDTWTSPPYFFNRYTPLNPTYPLVLDSEPTRPLPW